MSDNFRKDEKVHVEYDGIVGYSSSSHDVMIRDEEGYAHVYTPNKSVKITRIQPQVELGDLWKANGSMYVARNQLDVEVMTKITCPESINFKSFFERYPDAELIFRLSDKSD